VPQHAFGTVLQLAFESIAILATDGTKNDSLCIRTLANVTSPFESALVAGLAAEQMLTMRVLSRLVRHQV
jgi:hypothetical protein